MKVSELTGAKLDYWVAKAEGRVNDAWNGVVCANTDWSTGHPVNKCEIYSPSTNWSQAGPIIERYGIDTTVVIESAYGDDLAGATRAWSSGRDGWEEYWGNTPLEAAMRCFVASKFGEEVPDESVG